MSDPAFVGYDVGLRIVNSVGAVTGGPYAISDPDSALASYGIVMSECKPPMFTPHYQTEWENGNYQKRWRLLGLRVGLSITFALAFTDGTRPNYGIDFLRNLYNSAVNDTVFGGLQVNFWQTDAAQWLGVKLTSGFEPELFEGKEANGYALRLTAESVNLVSSVGNFAQRKWWS